MKVKRNLQLGGLSIMIIRFTDKECGCYLRLKVPLFHGTQSQKRGPIQLYLTSELSRCFAQSRFKRNI